VRGAAGPELLERLRAVVGPAGAGIADDLVDALRRELRNEYERGYREGRIASSRRPPETDDERARRRMHQRAHRRKQEWLLSTRQLRRTLVNVLLVLVTCAVGFFASVQVARSGKKPPSALQR